MASEAWAECGRSAIAVAADAAGTGVLDERSCDAVVLRLRGESSGAVDSVLRRRRVSDSQLRRCQDTAYLDLFGAGAGESFT